MRHKGFDIWQSDRGKFIVQYDEEGRRGQRQFKTASAAKHWIDHRGPFIDPYRDNPLGTAIVIAAVTAAAGALAIYAVQRFTTKPAPPPPPKPLLDFQVNWPQ